MDKNAIKKFAIWARKELIARVTQRAYLYGVDGEQELDAEQKEVNGRLLSAVERRQRRTLVNRVKEKGFESVMDEAAYTWFNRFAALRYMEVNGVLPTKVRVFTDSEGAFQPQILTECLTMDNLEGLNKEIVFALKEQDKTDELYKYLLITQCNALGTILPAMFEQIEDYTELLLPDNLLRQGSVIEQMVTSIPEDDWRDAVQIIGWLYQYYNSEPKDAVFAALKKNVKVSKENIPAATQLFTPDWIVRYMVENSLGRIWIEHKEAEGLMHNGTFSYDGTQTLNGTSSEEASSQYEKDFAQRMDWKYYLPEAKQEPDVAAELKKLRAERKDLAPTDIKVIDPCMGSGHILVYAFDVLVQIYKDAGYQPKDAPALILQNNLYGLDIDDRAYQLAYFAIMMKARKYSRRILTSKIKPPVYSIQESNGITKKQLQSMGESLSPEEKTKALSQAEKLVNLFHDAKEYGSILNIPELDWDLLRRFATPDTTEEQPRLNWNQEASKRLIQLIDQGIVLAKKYLVVCTNPPYMGISSANSNLNKFAKKYYPNSKNDFFSIFIEKAINLTKKEGKTSLITQNSWMFLARFEMMRKEILNKTSIQSMIHLGARAFEEIGGEAVQTTMFVLRNTKLNDYCGTYIRLVELNNYIEKEKAFLSLNNGILDKRLKYYATPESFFNIPGCPIAYWIPLMAKKLFLKETISNYSISASQNVTGNNDLYLRKFWEVEKDKIGENMKWIFYAKGGGFRKWYGNLWETVNWTPDARKNYQDGHGSQIIPKDYWYKKGITWGLTSKASFRVLPEGSTYDKQGSSIFISQEIYYYPILALLNSCVAEYFLTVLNPSLSYQVRDIRNIPSDKNILKNNLISCLAMNCIEITKDDWDSFETSWDFQRYPMLPTTVGLSVADCYATFQSDCEERFLALKSNEKEINRIFIDIYGLQDELTPDVADKDVTVARIYDTKDDIPDSMKGNNYVLTKSDVVKSLLSYAVGCMFGRYSLDVPGLAYAGGEFDWSKYPTFRPDEDDIIPICDDEYFEDDIVDRFCVWLRTVYGEEHYQENLQFISDALGGKGSPLENIRSYFLNDFYKDHCKTYKKRPIYWLFDAGRKNSFKALVYIHRYDRDTIARMRTGYVYKQQELYKTRIETYKKRVDTAASQADKNKYKKELKRLQDQFDEIHAYEEKIHHYADLRQEIDLDDGIKHNYALFADVLAKIK